MEAFFNDNPRPSKRLSYGTAGFRANVNLPLNSVFSRMGVLASLRSLVLQNQPIGVMITASHNAEEDNGLKIVDFDGGMLTQSWEPLAEQLVNAESGAEAMVVVTNILKPFEPIAPREPVVIIGRDTRPHSMELFECVRNGASVAGAQIIDLGEVSTPLLHFVVHYLHSTHRHEPITQALINEAREQYCSRTVGGYRDLVSLVPREAPHRIKRIIVDCSFGVGSISLQQVLDVFGSRSSDDIVVEMRNVARAGRVNEGCGAELVQKGVNPPSVGIDSNTDAGVLLCSYDGDADRIVFHGFCNNGWILLDGDKIAALLASLVHTELVKAGLSTEFTLGVVQSAYANGASTNYFRSNNIPVAMAKTGVKYMHHVALDFDIGTYFEANGHGTILFSQRFATVVNEQVAELEENRNTSSEVYQGLKNLQACMKVINPAVGDAISDMFLALAALQVLGLTTEAWAGLYSDLPSKMIKVAVADKNRIVCNDDETRALAPPGLQEALDAAMSTVTNGRCFVRPSGTEDVVRVYAEASTAEGVAQLLELSVQAINRFAN